MHLFVVNILGFFHGLCLFYSVAGVNCGVADLRKRSLAVPQATALDKKLPGALSDILIENRMTVSGVTVSGESIVCSDASCKIKVDRKKRSVMSDSPVAQTKQTEDDKKREQTVKSMITPYAFGNPALPRQSKKRNGKPKSNKPKG